MKMRDIEKYHKEYKTLLILRNKASNLRILTYSIICKSIQNKMNQTKHKRHMTKTKHETINQLAKETSI